MTTPSYLSAFAADPMALEFARLGDVQVACLCLAARVAELPVRRLLDDPWDGSPHHAGWLEIGLPHGLAYCQLGRILVGVLGTPLSGYRFINGSCRAMMIDKMATKIVLGVLGFPVPEGMVYGHEEAERAVDYARSRRGAVCIKPVDGGMGKDVFPGLSDPTSIRGAVDHLVRANRRILVEDHLEGDAFRFFFLYPRVVGVRLDLPANVVGDGRSTVAQLLRRKNGMKRLRTGQAPVNIGPRERQLLAKQGLAASDVPEPGRRVFLRDMSNSGQGGDSIVAMHGVHQDYISEVERLCLGIQGLRMTAVDTIIRRPDQPASSGGYAILELNASPGMVQFRFPWDGPSLDLAPMIIDLLMRERFDE